MHNGTPLVSNKTRVPLFVASNQSPNYPLIVIMVFLPNAQNVLYVLRHPVNTLLTTFKLL